MMWVKLFCCIAAVATDTTEDEDCNVPDLLLLQLAHASNASQMQAQEVHQDKQRPNFLLLIPDGWRYDWDGFYSDVPLNLPTIKSLASKGVRFTQAYVSAPYCTPSRKAMASGRDYDEAGTDGKFDDTDYPGTGLTMDDMPPYFLLLKNAGYHTMTAGKDDLTKTSLLGTAADFFGCETCTWGDGLYHQEELGFSDGFRIVDKTDMMDYWPKVIDPLSAELQKRFVTLPNGTVMNRFDVLYYCYKATGEFEIADTAHWLDPDVCNNETYTVEAQEDVLITEAAVKLLRRRPREKPFFLQVAFLSPHEPFLVTQEMRASVSHRIWPKAVDDNAGICPGGACDARGVDGNYSRCNYAALLEHVDGLFQKLLDELQYQGVLDNTYVIFTSDHGEMLGDHDMEGKRMFYHSSASVPLMISGPRIPKGLDLSSPVSNRDVTGTILDLAGIPLAPNMTTRSLRPIWQQDGSWYRNEIKISLLSWRAVVKSIDGSIYKYVRCYNYCTLAPPSLPLTTTTTTRAPGSTPWISMLFNVSSDPQDMHDISEERPDLAKMLCLKLPTRANVDDVNVDFTRDC